MLRKKGYIDKYNLNIYSLKLELQLRITLQRAKINEAIYLNYVAICDLERYIRSCYILTMMFGRGARMCVYFCFNIKFSLTISICIYISVVYYRSMTIFICFRHMYNQFDELETNN